MTLMISTVTNFTLPLVGLITKLNFCVISCYIVTVMAIINSLLGIIIKFPLIMFHFLTISDNVVDTKTKVFRVLVSYYITTTRDYSY